MKQTQSNILLLFVATLLIFTSCALLPQGGGNENDIIIDVTNPTGTSGTLNVANGMISSTEAGQWLSFKADVKEAGRYKVIVEYANPKNDAAALWVEDYIENKDGRTYNVTGDLSLEKTADEKSLATVSKDGSPLNKGKHSMKLHFKNADIYVKSIKFSLMKAHQATPKNMVQSTEGTEWKVVWSDEFEGEGLPDTSKWTYDIGDWGWGNNELQYYTEFKTKNARQENGNLIIESHKNDDGNKWTSARLTTRGKVNFTYGKIEFSAKVPPKRGTWAAGWTLGDKYVDELSWPYCGEIDIMESVGYEMDDETGKGVAHSTVHTKAFYFKIGNHKSGTVPVEKMYQEFHTYAVEWTPEGIKGFVDGKEYYSYNETTPEAAWPFDKPQNIILNLAMGGGWGGAKGMDDSYDSQQIVIDYVRVYELK